MRREEVGVGRVGGEMQRHSVNRRRRRCRAQFRQRPSEGSQRYRGRQHRWLHDAFTVATTSTFVGSVRVGVGVSATVGYGS